VLAALGRAVNRLAEERLSGEHPAWRAVEAWLAADEIEHLVVLRAHRLLPTVWHRLTQACHRTGVGLLLVAHVPAVPDPLTATLAGTGYQTLTDPARAHRALTTRARPPAPAQAARPAVPPQAHDRGQQAPALIGTGLVRRDDPGFAHGRHRARQWLAAQAHDKARDRPGLDIPGADITAVQLLLARLVQDSADLDRTQALLAGARSAFADHGFDLRLPGHALLPEPGTRALSGHLYGPGLPRACDPLDRRTVARIRAGVANPVLAAGIAAALLTELPTQTLHSLPWQALADGEATLCLSQFVHGSLLQPRPGMNPRKAQYTAVLPVPAHARALFLAARHFSRHGDALPGRMFAATCFTSRFLQPAAANCGIRLPDQPISNRAEYRTVRDSWPARITCTRMTSRPHSLAPVFHTRPRSALRAFS
jgi:hypothetical protein